MMKAATDLFMAKLATLGYPIYSGQIDDGATMPYVVAQIFTGTPDDTKTSLGLELEIQIKVLHDGLEEGLKLANDISSLMHNSDLGGNIQFCRRTYNQTFNGGISLGGAEAIIPQTIMKFELLVKEF